MGTLQRLPKIVGNDSLVRELAYTARKMLSDEAARCGLVSRVCHDQKEVVAAALEMAQVVASKSPVAVEGTKHNLNYAREHPTENALEYMVCVGVCGAGCVRGRAACACVFGQRVCAREPHRAACAHARAHCGASSRVQATWNMSMLQTEDLVRAAEAFMSKSEAKFADIGGGKEE